MILYKRTVFAFDCRATICESGDVESEDSQRPATHLDKSGRGFQRDCVAWSTILRMHAGWKYKVPLFSEADPALLCVSAADVLASLSAAATPSRRWPSRCIYCDYPMKTLLAGLALCMLTGCVSQVVPTASPPVLSSDERHLQTSDFHVATEDGMRVFVREIRPGGNVKGEPLIMLHGARAPGIASFDLPVANGSLARDLAWRAQRVVYVMDARGYGASDRPAALSAAPANNPPQSRAFEVVRDIGAVVQAAKLRTASRQVAILGWATGGMWGALYASLQPQDVHHLIVLNALYGGSSRHAQFGAGSSLSDPGRPDQLSPDIGAYALYEAASLLTVWDRSIQLADKTAWRDPAIAEAYARTTLASDPDASTHTPPRFRAPLGALEDSFYQANGRRLFDASSIAAHVLLVRSERDFWSRPEDVDAFTHDASHAASVRALSLADATHFVHLDQAQHGRSQLIDAVVEFLQGN